MSLTDEQKAHFEQLIKNGQPILSRQFIEKLEKIDKDDAKFITDTLLNKFKAENGIMHILKTGIDLTKEFVIGICNKLKETGHINCAKNIYISAIYNLETNTKNNDNSLLTNFSLPLLEELNKLPSNSPTRTISSIIEEVDEHSETKAGTSKPSTSIKATETNARRDSVKSNDSVYFS